MYCISLVIKVTLSKSLWSLRAESGATSTPYRVLFYHLIISLAKLLFAAVVNQKFEWDWGDESANVQETFTDELIGTHYFKFGVISHKYIGNTHSIV